MDEQDFEVETAFVVFLRDGQAFGTNDLGELTVNFEGKPVKIKPARKAEPDDLYRASMEVAKDVQIAQTAQAVVQMSMQVSQQMAEQMQAQKIAQQAGLHVPNR